MKQETIFSNEQLLLNSSNKNTNEIITRILHFNTNLLPICVKYQFKKGLSQKDNFSIFCHIERSQMYFALVVGLKLIDIGKKRAAKL